MARTRFESDSLDKIEGLLRGIEYVNDSAISIVEFSDDPPFLIVEDGDSEDDDSTTTL